MTLPISVKIKQEVDSMGKRFALELCIHPNHTHNPKRQNHSKQLAGKEVTIDYNIQHTNSYVLSKKHNMKCKNLPVGIQEEVASSAQDTV